MNAITLFPLDDAPRANPIDTRPLIVDSFAGGGGASTGIDLALGRSPDIAINHNAAALALHAANHPETLHLSENVYRVDPLNHMNGRHIGLMWFSPDCKHFSKAKGGAPVKRNIRDLAWIIPGWIERIQKSGGKVDIVALENVEEFKDWCPLIETEKGLMPDWSRRGETFQKWCKALRRLGGKIEMRELRACDYGTPTIRKRLFVVIRFDKQRIQWPAPTHGNPASAEVKAGKLLPWRTAAECIDWSEPCPSIFDSRAEILEKHGLKSQRPLKPNTLHRIARGIARYVLEAERPFIVNLTHGAREEDLAEPLRTITGAHRGEKAVVVPSIVGCGGRAGQSRPRGGDEPFATVTAKADACLITPALATFYGHGDGRGVRNADLTDPLRTVTVENRHALISPSITRFNSGATGSDMREPIPTVTANSWIKKPGGAAPLGMIAPYLASLAHGDSGGRREYSLEESLGTVTVGGIQHAFVAPHLLSLKGSSRRMRPIDQPHPTVLAEGNHSALIAPHIMTMRNSGKPFQGADQPTHTITASGAGLSMIAASMVQTGYGEREGQKPRALDIRKPLGTVVAGGAKHAPIAAFLARQFGNSIGHAAEMPHGTITAGGAGKSAPVAAFLAQQNNDSRRAGGVNPGRPAEAPMSTICQSGSHQNVTQVELAPPHFGPEHEAKARKVAHLLREFGLWDDREFVTLSIDNADFVIVDVGMRMLTPRELFRAQGFPDDYVIEGVWEGLDTEDPTFRAFPKDVQVSCCGNSVCPPLAEALIRANCAHLMVGEVAV